MADEPLSDDEIIARERKNYRSVLRLTTAMIGSAGLALLLMFGALELGDLQGISQAAFTALIAVPLLIVLAFGGFIMLYRRPPEGARSERIIRKQIDDYHARWRWSFLIILCILLNDAVRLTRSSDAQGSGMSFYSFCFLILFVAWIVCFGPGGKDSAYRRATNDELTQALRSRSVVAGYFSLIILLCAFNVAVRNYPGLEASLLPSLLFAAIAIPTLYFLVLQWRAGRSG